MAIWHAARLDPSGDSPGWLARYLDTPGFKSATVGKSKPKGGGDAPALHISKSLLPQALLGSQRHVPSLSSLEQFRRRLGIPESFAAAEQRAALDQISRQDRGRPGSLLEFVERSTLITYASSARLEEVLNGKGKTAPAGYPEFYGLGRRLRLIAQLIKAGLTTSIY